MRFTVIATGRFSLRRAFGLRLTASSLTQLSVVNSLIRPAGLAPAWLTASPAHAETQKLIKGKFPVSFEFLSFGFHTIPSVLP
jgi:hypothetical protein